MSILTRPVGPIDKAANAIPGLGPWILAIAALALRIYAALPFWKSGVLKWEGETLIDKLTTLQIDGSVAFLF